MSAAHSAAFPVCIRLSKGLRVYIVVFGATWLSMTFAVMFLGSTSGGIFLIMPLLMMAYGAVAMGRALMLKVVTDGDYLVVRNIVRTWSFDRSEIEGFRVGDSGIGRQRAVHVLVRGGEMKMLHATIQLSPFGHGRQSELAAQLRAWLAQ